MKRLRGYELALGFLIATIFWVVVAIIYPKYHGGEEQTRENPAPISAHEIEAETNKRIADYNRTLDWLTAGLVIANIALWWATWRGSKRQSGDMRATLDHARQSLTVIERAFVSMTDMGITTIGQHGVIIDYRIDIRIVNSGRTPARDYIARANFAVFDAIPANFRFPDRSYEEMSANTVLTAQMITVLRVDIFIQDAIAIYEKKKSGIIWGWIEYNDIFPGSPRHRGEFCMIVEIFADPRQTPQVIRGEGVPIISARPWGKYNAHDDDCLYRPGETPVAKDGELPPSTPPPQQRTPVV